MDDAIAAERLASLLERLDRLDALVPTSVEGFVLDRDAQELAAFSLLLAVQDALDLAARWVAREGWELPRTARDHFEVLARHGVVPAALARDLAGCAGLRNLIAHAYGTLDLRRLHAELPAGRQALRAFAALAAGG